MKAKLNIKGINVKFDEISYKLINELPQGEIDIDVKQEINLLECGEKKIKIQMSRKISCLENIGFTLYVSCLVDFLLTDDSYKNFNNLDEMKKYADDKKGYLIDQIQLGAHISQMIAEITGKFGNAPLILPPVLNSDSEK